MVELERDKPLNDLSPIVELPSGLRFDPRRSRWDGVLDAEELTFCRANGIALGYDPVQIGWVVDQPEVDITAAPRLDFTVGPGAQMGIVFRPWSDDDLAIHRALLDDPAVWRHLPEAYPQPFAANTSRDLIELANADLGHEVVAVEFGGEVVGQCLMRFDDGSPAAGRAEVAYWLGRSHWGRGIMSLVVPAFVERCWSNHPVDRLHAWIHPDNAASERVAERAGFSPEAALGNAGRPATPPAPGFARWVLDRPR